MNKQTNITTRIVSKGQDHWVCPCGNHTMAAGFFPINSELREVEPTPSDWDTNWYGCGRCGAVIDVDSLDILNVGTGQYA